MRPKFLLGMIIAAGLAAAPASSADVVYIYDALGRVIQVIYPSGKTVTYTYDAAGNIISVVTTP